MLSKAMLCTTSKYFAKALDGDFAESEKRELTLPGADIESVRLFIFWLCKHDLPDTAKEMDTHALGSKIWTDFVAQEQESLIRLWCFADQFILPKLQNVTMKRFL